MASAAITKLQKQLTSAKASASRARKEAKTARSSAVVRGAGLLTAYGIGSLEANGRMEDIPQILGLPRTVTLAGAAMLLAPHVDGYMGDVLDGVGESAMYIAAYNFGAGRDISGATLPEGDDLEALKDELMSMNEEDDEEYIDVEEAA